MDSGKQAFDETKLFGSFTKPLLKEWVDQYNSNSNTKEKIPKGVTSSVKKKEEMIAGIIESLPSDQRKKLPEILSPIIIPELLKRAVNFFDKRTNLDKFIQMQKIPGKSGFEITFNRKESILKSSGWVENGNFCFTCDCSKGESQSICFHTTAIFVAMLRRNMVKHQHFPFLLTDEALHPYLPKLSKVEAEQAYGSNPDVLLSNNYRFTLESDGVVMEWGGAYAGKKIQHELGKYSNFSEFIADKVIDVMVKPLKIKEQSGSPRVLIEDRIGIVDIIINDEKYSSRLLKKFEKFPDLPHTLDNLTTYLKADLGNFSKLKSEIREESDVPPFEPYGGNDPYIFVSYPHADRKEIYPILQRLHREKFKIWFDHGIPTAKGWAEYIATRLIGAKVILSFISEHALASPNTMDEIELALNEHVPIIAIYLRKTEFTPGLKLRLRRIQGLEKFNLEEKEFFSRLIVDLNEILT